MEQETQDDEKVNLPSFSGEGNIMSIPAILKTGNSISTKLPLEILFFRAQLTLPVHHLILAECQSNDMTRGKRLSEN